MTASAAAGRDKTPAGTDTRAAPDRDARSVGATRSQVRAWLAAQRAAGGYGPTVDAFARTHDAAFSALLGAQGWLGLTWPARYGGHDCSALARFAVIEELLAAGAPVAAHWIAERQTGPLLLRHGTEEQRRRFLPRIAAGDLFVAAGLSEPDSGSDLASVRTRAVRVDGGWRVTGRKVWTSHAHRSHWLVALVRTEPLASSDGDRHRGLSQLLVDLAAPGVAVSPIAVMGGGPAHFCEVVLDEVFVPDDHVVGAVGAGWAQVSSELTDERSGPERYLACLPLLVELVRALESAQPDPRTAQQLGELLGRLRAVRATSVAVQRAIALGEDPARTSVRAALVKDVGTTLEQRLVEVAADITAELPTPPPTLARLLAEAQAAAPTFTLRGGTTEIMRSIVSRSLDARPPVLDDVGRTVSALVTRHLDAARAEEREFGHSPTLEAALRDSGFLDAPLPGTGDADSEAARSVLRMLGRRAVPDAILCSSGRHDDHHCTRSSVEVARMLVVTGSLRRVLELSVGHARTRTQFGQPLVAFQAVGQQLARLAGAVATADAAVDTAADLLDHATADVAVPAVLAAIVATDRSVRRAVAIAHQVHGAMGVTAEYELHHHTSRLIAWRSTGTTAAAAAVELGGRAIAAGADALWAGLTATTDAGEQ